MAAATPAAAQQQHLQLPPGFDDWQTAAVVRYVQQHGFKRVTLQFPDQLLPAAADVAADVQHALASAAGRQEQQQPAAQVYVLADTSYNPLSVDEVAAAHVNADCIIHYGYASLHPVSRTPALCVLPRLALDVQRCSTWLLEQLAALHQQAAAAGSGGDSSPRATEQQQHAAAVVCCDQGYLHCLPELQAAVEARYSGPLQLVFAQSAPTELWPRGSPHAADQQQHQQVPIGGLLWQQPAAAADASATTHMVWLGPAAGGPALDHLQLSFAGRPWLRLDPAGANEDGSDGSSGPPHVQRGLAPHLAGVLKRRYYLVERARGASLVGLLVGTLGAAGYQDALEALRALAAKAGKRTYTLLVGKPNPAKLANFPELEVFVMLADPTGLVLDCREYLAPIISGHEAWLAFSGRPFDPATYRLDFAALLGGGSGTEAAQQQQQQGAVCGATTRLVGGNITAPDDDGSDGDEAQLLEQEEQALTGAAGALTISGSSGTALSGGPGGRQVSVRSGAQYLTQVRSFRGLETPAGGAEVLPAALAVEGRSGRAAGYADEPAA